MKRSFYADKTPLFFSIQVHNEKIMFYLWFMEVWKIRLGMLAMV